MSSTTLYITFLAKEGPFLKIWGQLDKKNIPIAIDKALADATASFNNGLHIPQSIQFFSLGNLCCAKFSDDAYYRAKIINVDSLHEGVVQVLFIDYGNTDIVQCKNIRTLEPFSREFRNIVPQSRDFYLMNVTHSGNDWDPVVIEQVMHMIRYVDVAIAECIQIGSNFLIKLVQNGRELSSLLKEAGYGVDVPTHIQQTLIQKTLIHKMQEPSPLQQPRYQPPEPSPPYNNPQMQQHPQQLTRPTILTFKSTPHELNSEHEIYVSYVTDGPLLFSIQLKKTEENLRALMNEINTVPLQPFSDTPAPSTMCLARSIEDGYICRGVVTNMVDGQYKIYYVDFGNTEMRSIDHIYEIPFKYIIPKLMATRFSLDGFDKAVVSVHMKVAFKEFVEHRLLNIRVKNRSAKTGLPLCDIFDEKGIQAVDVVRQAAFEAYPDPTQVAKGSAQPVHVTAVYSCNRFYIQLKGKDDDLQAMVAFMQQSCPSRKPLDKNEVFPGKPCAAQLTDDNLWHRALITEAFTNGTAKIFFVDLGREDTIRSCNLKQADYDQITMIRPQAVQCSLNGYQNMPADKERDAFLKDILLKQVEFTAKTVDVLGTLVLVDLIDGKNYNVASLLLEKLATSRSQISPLLIQDSNTIEFKKRSPQANERGSYNNSDKRSSFKPRETIGNRYEGQRNQNQGNSGTDSSSEKDVSPDKKTYGRQNKPTDRTNNSFPPNSNKFTHKNTRDGMPPAGKPNRISSKASDSGSDVWDESSKKDNKSTFASSNRREYNKPDGRGDRDNRSNSNRGNNFQSPTKVEETPIFACVDAQYLPQVLVGTTKNVEICWFHNPGSFYVQLDNSKDELKTVINSLQANYKKRSTGTAVLNQAVVAQYPSDNVFYRAIVLDIAPGKYKVQYVDYGNISAATNIYSIEEQHMALPAQAVRCQLSGITPVGAEWPKANLMQKHFKLNVFTCEFVNQLEDRFEVVLRNNSDSIANLLISDGFAAAVLTLEPTLLLYQEIKVLVNAVNSLSDFIIEVEPNVKVHCSLHNLAQATETFEATLNGLVGYFVIAFFDHIQDNRAEVTLYDTFGMKLKLIEPDEGALASISPLCALPVFLSSVNGFVSHATATSIFVQPSKYTNFVAQILEAMFSMYNGVENTEPVVPEDGFEYAVLSPDENWYRGKITAISNDTVTVHYVDYGNDETVNTSSLRILDGSLYDPHELCIEIRMDKNNESLLETEVTVNVAYLDDGWTAVEKEEIEAEVKKVETPVAVPVVVPNVAPAVAPVQEEIIVQPADLTSDAPIEPYGIPIVVSHIDSPNSFYVQLAHDLDAIDTLQANLLAEIDSLTDAKEPTIGMLCAAIYNETQEWYRAEVLGIDGDKVTMRFVDYGNSDVVDSTQSKIKLLPANLQSIDRYSRPCSLYITSIPSETNTWSAEACARFEELAYVEGICAEIIQQNEDITYIHIYCDDINLAETLVNENHAVKMGDESVTVDATAQPTTTIDQPTPLPTAEQPAPADCPGIPVQVSHIDSPGQFYLQLATDLAAIDALQADLQSQVEQLPDVETATPGVLCAAIYSACQEWFRAQVLDIDDDITTVRFVDYGNTDVLDNKQTKVKTLSPELLSLEQYARRCSLYVQPSIESSDWSQEACSRFEELAYTENIRAEIIEQDDKTTYINLFANNVNIGDLLVSEKHGQPMQFETQATYPTGFISHVNSPSEFWIQLENACGDLERIADQLERDANTFGTLSDMSPGTLCAAVFREDDNWYRARILSNTVAGLEVLFIDYGNSCTCTNLRELPEDLVMTPALAQKCCLQKPDGVLQWSPAATETFKEIAADGRTIFVVHNLVPGETTITQLYLDDQDISQHLLPITEEGYVSHYEKLDQIWIRKSSDLSKLQKWTVMLPNAKNWPKATETDKITAAYSETDDSWHRAKVVEKIEGQQEKYRVLLVDSGAQITTNDIREWPADCMEDIEPLASKYKLQPLPGYKWTTESDTQFQELNANGKTIFHVEYISDEVVQLYYDMQDVRNSLDSVKSTPSTSHQSTPSKKAAKEFNNEDITTTKSEPIIAETPIESIDDSLDSVKSTPSSKDAPKEVSNEDTTTTKSEPIIGETPSESIDVSDIVLEIVNNSTTRVNNISSPDEPKTIDDTEVSTFIEDEVHVIVNELINNSVKLPKESETVKLIDDNNLSSNKAAISEVKEIVDDLVKNSVKNSDNDVENIDDNTTSNAKELTPFEPTEPFKVNTDSAALNEVNDLQSEEDVAIKNVTAINNDDVSINDCKISKDGDDTGVISDIVNELLVESTKSPIKLNVENTNVAEKSVLSTVDKRDLNDVDSTSDVTITSNSTEDIPEELNKELDPKVLSSDIIHSIVDDLV